MTEVEYLSLPDLFVSEREREREADRATWKEMKSDICYDSGRELILSRRVGNYLRICVFEHFV